MVIRGRKEANLSEDTILDAVPVHKPGRQRGQQAGQRGQQELKLPSSVLHGIESRRAVGEDAVPVFLSTGVGNCAEMEKGSVMGSAGLGRERGCHGVACGVRALLSRADSAS